MTIRTSMVALGCLLACGAATADTVRLDSVSIKRQLPAQALAAHSAQATGQANDAVYIVKIKGVLPTNRALPVQLFIGDYPIREYGATADGIYFKLRDPQLMRQLHGKPFRYATGPGTPRQTGLVFQAPAQ